MSAGLLAAMAFCSALGAGLMAGLFFAFSVSVMSALGSRPPAEGMAVMQAINRAILNPIFLTVFFGTLVACAMVVLGALLRWEEPGRAWLLAGALSYIVGGFLVTLLCNVPRNNALDRAAAADPQSARLWAAYLSEWTAWNHVRTAACAAALALLVAGLP